MTYIFTNTIWYIVSKYIQLHTSAHTHDRYIYIHTYTLFTFPM